jgi:hypothetical protein
MHTRPDRRRCPLHRLALGACCLVLATSPSAFGQLLEFKSSEVRGRIDRPSAENVWILGDDNGNGALDDDETFGPRVSVEHVFLNDPGYEVLLGARSRPRSASFEGAYLMHELQFVGEPDDSPLQLNQTLNVGYGARFFQGMQDFRFSRTGGVLGRFEIDSAIESQSLGPQVSLTWALRRGPWQATAQAAAALTYTNLDGDQYAQIGVDLIPGQYNRPLYMLSTRTDSHFNEWDVSPAFEASLRASYDITPTTQCFIRGDALQFGNVRNAEDGIIYTLPRMGLQDPGGYDITVTAASIGLEVRR